MEWAFDTTKMQPEWAMHTWAMTTPGAHARRDLTARFACRGVRAKAHRDATANPVVPNHAALEVSVEYLKWMAHNVHRRVCDALRWITGTSLTMITCCMPRGCTPCPQNYSSTELAPEFMSTCDACRKVGNWNGLQLLWLYGVWQPTAEQLCTFEPRARISELRCWGCC